MNRLWTLPVLVALCSSLYSQTAHVASHDANQILSEEVVISGTTTLDSQQLNEITTSPTARTMGDDQKEVTDRIRDAFLQRGYLRAEVTNVPRAAPTVGKYRADRFGR